VFLNGEKGRRRWQEALYGDVHDDGAIREAGARAGEIVELGAGVAHIHLRVNVDPQFWGGTWTGDDARKKTAELHWREMAGL